MAEVFNTKHTCPTPSQDLAKALLLTSMLDYKVYECRGSYYA